MKKKNISAIAYLVGGVLVIGACSKPAVEEPPAPVVDEPPVVEQAVAEPEPELPTEPEPVMVEEEPAPIEEVAQASAIPDSAGYVYMIRPDDYLVKIAQQEHDDYYAWRRIYNRNREDIGENPNLIYPYHEILLSKLEPDIVRWEYAFSMHVVQPGETLWSIAGDTYGNPIAWVVIFLDNRAVIGSDAAKLEPGMELQIRSGLWGD